MLTDKQISELAAKVQSMIGSVRNGYPSEYHNITINEDTEEEESITIRVSNHGANPARITGRNLIFVIPDAQRDIERDDDDVTSFHINKKSFPRVLGTVYLDENNLDENGHDIEYILDYEIN
jgi:hypothetical protein